MTANRLLFVGVVCLVATGTGCASIVKGSGPQSISITSKPADAKVRIVDVNTGAEIQTGTTPMTIALKKSNGFFQGAHYKVQVAKDGFEDRELALDARANGWYIAGNFVFGGFIGWLIVDPATGAMWTLDPDVLNFDLKEIEKPADATAQPVASAGAIMTIDELAQRHPELVSQLKPVAN
jgi:hypothetical protein